MATGWSWQTVALLQRASADSLQPKLSFNLVKTTTYYYTIKNKEISYSNLKSLMGTNKDLLLVDVRSKDEVDRGCIPGSLHIPVEDVEKAFSLDAQDFMEKFGVSKPQLESRDLVFHCQMGRRGGAATEKARGLGFTNARNYTGGYKEWAEKEGK